MKVITALGFLLFGMLPAASQQDWTAWEWEAPLDVKESGMTRLEAPPAVLDVSRADLGDLRLLSPAGAETPYLIDLPRYQTVGVKEATGFKVTQIGQTTLVEVVSRTTEDIHAVELISPAREFLKSVKVEARFVADEWQALGTGEVMFRQADGTSRSRIAIPAGRWVQWRFTVDDTRSPPVPFTGVRVITSGKNPETAELPVSIKSREEVQGETRLTLDLGARNLNLAELRFNITDAVFSRSCKLEVSTIQANGESRQERLGGGVPYRVIGDRAISAEQAVIPVNQRIAARYLVATFQNGDSPPLTITGAKLRVYPTILAFHAPQAGAYRLLAGNRGETPPDYDLNSLRGAMESTSGQLLTPGPLKAKADFRLPATLPDVESAGATIDLANWTRRRQVDAALPGVIQIELDPWALAGSQLGLGDLRLIQNGRQIPYLIKPDPVIRELTPAMRLLPDDPKRPTISRWEISLPVDGLPSLQCTAHSTAPLFSRRFEAFADRKDDLGNSWTENLGTADWAKSPGRPAPLTLPLRGIRIPLKFHLQTDHGDNPPILLESPRVRIAAPVIIAKLTADSPLFLVYGNPKATPPQYDLQLVRKELMAAAPQSASLRAEEILGPDKRETMSVNAGSPWLWIALGGVVVALLFIVAKLLPRPAAD